MNRSGPVHRGRPAASVRDEPGLPGSVREGAAPAVRRHMPGRRRVKTRARAPTAHAPAASAADLTAADNGPDRERGSATILAVGVMAALVLFAGAFAAMGQASAARHRAQGAADAAALAGAARVFLGEAEVCEAAAELIAEGDAALERCEVHGLAVTVHVAVEPLGVPAVFGPARAVSRAGPVTAR